MLLGRLAKLSWNLCAAEGWYNDQYAFARVTARDSVLVVLNNAATEAALRIPMGGSRIGDGVTIRDELDATPAVTTHAGAVELRIAARSAAIYH